MPASIDFDYPHPGDVVGRSFPAGGDYDATGLIRELKGKQVRLTDKDPLPAGSKVICRLFDSDGTLLGERTVNIDGKPALGFWDTPNFSVTDDAEDCVLRAVLQVGIEPPTGYPADVIEDVDIEQDAGGTFELTPTP
jgi:hypothetical protein